MSDIIKLSVSKVKTYKDCNKKYQFVYELKMPRKEFDYHLLGKFVHSVLENFHQLYIDGTKELYHIMMGKIYKQVLAEYKDKISKDIQKEAYQIIDNYLKQISSVKKLSNVLSVEKHFSIPLTNDIVLTGMIDRIQLDNDGIIHVADYKTTKNKKYLKNDFLQLLTYAFVLYQENPSIEKIRGSYILLRHECEYMTKEFSKDDILKIKDEYENYAKSIRSDKLWRANPSKLCDFCEYLPLCEDGLKYITKDIKIGQTNW